MTCFYLVRHGEADYSQPSKWKTLGWGADLATLSPKGILQIEEAAVSLKEKTASKIVSSPATRALQSATIIQRELDLPVSVEFDIHEWVPDRTFSWCTHEEVSVLIRELQEFGGEWPKNSERVWEQLSAVKARSTTVLNKYLDCDKVIVVCHEIVIWSLTGRQFTNLGEVVELTL